MSEAEQLRQEIAELRKRLHALEAREERLDGLQQKAYRQMRDDWLRLNPPQQPTFVQEMSRHFPPGTILC